MELPIEHYEHIINNFIASKNDKTTLACVEQTGTDFTIKFSITIQIESERNKRAITLKCIVGLSGDMEDNRPEQVAVELETIVARNLSLNINEYDIYKAVNNIQKDWLATGCIYYDPDQDVLIYRRAIPTCALTFNEHMLNNAFAFVDTEIEQIIGQLKKAIENQ